MFFKNNINNMDVLGNFINTTFILTLGLLIIISGIGMLYFYRRLNLLENSLIEHGKILQNFIINYNNNILKSQFMNSHSNNNVNINTTDSSNNLFQKINVSDNEEVDDEETDDEETDDEETDDEETDHEETDHEETDHEETINEENINEESNNEESVNEDSDNEESINTDKLVIHNKISDEKDNDELFIENLPIVINKEAKLINILENNDTNNEKKNYSKMKVDDLRSLVVTKNLTDNENALKLKKTELIDMLKQ